MESTTGNFKQNASEALADDKLKAALAKLSEGFPAKRREAADRLPEFEALRDQARDIKTHVLANLDFYLEQFEARVIEAEDDALLFVINRGLYDYDLEIAVKGYAPVKAQSRMYSVVRTRLQRAD